MTNNLIKGIDEVIKGLTTIKGALMTQGTAPVIKEAVKEAIEEVLPNVEAPAEKETPKVKAKSKPDPADKDLDVEKIEKEYIEEKESEDKAPAVDGFDREAKKTELEAMKYNDLKALAGTIEGVSAKGKKDEIIEKILDALEGGAEVEEEEPEEDNQEVQDETEESQDDTDEEDDEEGTEYSEEDVEDFVEFLESLETDEIKSIAKEAGLKVPKKAVKAKLIEELVADLDVLTQTLEDMGYYDEEEEGEEQEDAPEEAPEQEDEAGEEEDEEARIAEEYGLEDMTVEELADICAEFELSTKGKKQALIDRIVKGIMDGTIELEDEDGEDEPEEQEEEAQEEEKAPLKKVKEHDNPQMAEKEAEVEADIRSKYDKKKLKDSAIKKFLDKYNEGDPECAGCKGCSKEEMLECYIDIHKALVDDDGDLNEFEEPYTRDEEYFCCGREIKELDNGNLYCSVCGTEYEA